MGDAIAAPMRLSWRQRLTGRVKAPAVVNKSWWRPLVRESYTGAWQSNVTVDMTSVSSNWAVFACVSLIANDIGKMPAFVMRYDETQGIWVKVVKRRVLDIPNKFQVWTDFVRSWMFSLLLTGNTYVLRVLDDKGFVTALYVLDPRSVRPVVTPSGDVYYRVAADNLSGLQDSVTIPASAIMHDRINTLWHPLCGVSPLYASGVAAMQGLAMQDNSAQFFRNMSRPGGILTAPGHISDATAVRLKEYWETEFAGDAAGKIAVVGDGLKYEPMAMTAHDSQLIEQLRFTGEMICATFHVPPYKLGIGAPPSVGNIAALNQQYYDQCLHPLVEAIERRLDIGLEIVYPEQVWFDTDELLRMDPSTRWDSYGKAVGAGVMAPNEARRREQLPPAKGGEVPFLQMQNYSLADLARRSEAEAAKLAEGAEEDESVPVGAPMAASLLSVVDAIVADKIPPASARAILAAAFPTLTPAQIDGIVAPLATFDPAPEPEPEQPEPDPEQPEPEPPTPGDEEEEEERAVALQTLLARRLDVFTRTMLP